MLNLYTETAFQVKPVTPSSVIDRYTPTAQPSARRTHPRSESAFSKQYLATQSSLYFRHTKSHPRTFVWKVVSDDRCLEVRCADLAKPEKEHEEAYLTLRFHFKDAILPGCVVFTDLDNSDAIHAFVGTGQSTLYNLCIPTAYFSSNAARKADVGEWCQKVDIASLKSLHVHVIHALSPLEVYVGFTSGLIYKISKRGVDEAWGYSSYSGKSWTDSVRSLAMISRRGYHDIEHKGKAIAHDSAHAMLASPDGKHLFTICLDHRLRVWDLQSGRLVVVNDLLNKARDAKDRIQLNAAEPAFLRLVRLPLARHPVLVTYTPYEGGQFKFWELKGGLTDDLEAEDKYPNIELCPPDPDASGSTVWSMTGFDLIPGNESRANQLWVLFRNNNYHALYSVHFDFADIQEWSTSWVSCTPSSLTKFRPPEVFKSQVQDVTSKWLEFLFFPGRFTTETLETALAVLEDAGPAKVPGSIKKAPLQERLCSVVGSRVTLKKYNESQLDYERFSSDTDYHWRSLSRIVQTINDGRDAPLSLAVDQFQEMVWLTMADKCCAVRECSTFELLDQTQNEEVAKIESVTASRWPHKLISSDGGEPLEAIATLIKVSASFRQAFPSELAEKVGIALEEELHTSPERSTPHRMLEIYEHVNFAEEVSNETFTHLEKNLDPIGGPFGLNDDLFLALLDTISTSPKKARSSLQSTCFGLDLLAAGITNDLSGQRQVLADLSALVVFLLGESSEDDETTTTLDLPDMFARITEALRDVDKNLWLATHFRKIPTQLSTGAEPGKEDLRVVSILEDTLSKDIKPQPVVDRPQMYHLTEMIAEIRDWISGRGWIEPDDGIVYVQCSLIKQGDIDLATEFSRFQPDTAWSNYVKGRLYLAKRLFQEAAMYFRKSSYALACGKSIGKLADMSCGLISVQDSDSFNQGLSRFFEHIMSLFESEQAYVQAGEFGKLALQSNTDGKEPLSNFTPGVLLRLFEVELKCCRYEQAFETLLQLPNDGLQKTSAVKLIDAIFDITTSLSDRKGSIELFQSFSWSIQPQLSRHVDQYLFDLSKKQTSIPDSHSSTLPDYLQVRQSLCMARDDYRGSAMALYDRLNLLQRSGKVRNDPQATALRQTLLALINLMTCVDQEEAYIMADVEEGGVNGVTDSRMEGVDGGASKKRKIIITLADLRRDYQDLLDRCARLERGDFDFGMGEEDEDEDEDQQMIDQ